MDEYQLEIAEVRRKLEKLQLDEADPVIIEEHEIQLRNLKALYEAAQETFDAAEDQPRLPAALVAAGFGEWTFKNVYDFVYEAAMDAEVPGEDLAIEVQDTDYAASLLLALNEQS